MTETLTKLTRSDLVKLDHYIYEGKLFDALDIIEKIPEKDEQSSFINKVIVKATGRNNQPGVLAEVFKRFGKKPSDDTALEILTSFISRGELMKAEESVKLLERNLSPGEYEEILTSTILKGKSFNEVEKAVGRIDGRKLSDLEICVWISSKSKNIFVGWGELRKVALSITEDSIRDQMLEFIILKADTSCTITNCDERFWTIEKVVSEEVRKRITNSFWPILLRRDKDLAYRIRNDIPENIRKQEYEKAIVEYVESKDWEKARAIAGFAGRKLSDSELSEMISGRSFEAYELFKIVQMANSMEDSELADKKLMFVIRWKKSGFFGCRGESLSLEEEERLRFTKIYAAQSLSSSEKRTVELERLFCSFPDYELDATLIAAKSMPEGPRKVAVFEKLLRRAMKSESQFAHITVKACEKFLDEH